MLVWASPSPELLGRLAIGMGRARLGEVVKGEI